MVEQTKPIGIEDIEQFGDFKVPKISLRQSATILCDMAQQLDQEYVDFNYSVKPTEKYDKPIGCHKIICSECVFENEHAFIQWLAHKRLTGD
jgi:hypothetical protein